MSVPVSPDILNVASDAYNGSVPVGILISQISLEGDPVGAVNVLAPKLKEPVLLTGVFGADALRINTFVVYTDVPSVPSIPLCTSISGFDHVSVVSDV